MGWNGGYTIFEATVVGAYDLGLLDETLLGVLMEPYRGTDIDSGGERGLRSKDGLDVKEIVLKTLGIPIPPKPDLPDNYRTWTKDQYAMNDEYQEEYWGAFNEATKRFGWR